MWLSGIVASRIYRCIIWFPSFTVLVSFSVRRGDTESAVTTTKPIVTAAAAKSMQTRQAAVRRVDGSGSVHNQRPTERRATDRRLRKNPPQATGLFGLSVGMGERECERECERESPAGASASSARATRSANSTFLR